MALRSIEYPTRIRWLTRGTGTISEAKQKRLIVECQRQMSILVRDMAFQGLAQGQRRGNAGGYLFECVNRMGLKSVTVRMKHDAVGEGEVVEVCWCGCQMAVGVVIEVVEGLEEGVEGCTPCREEYPACALDDLGEFAGTRYRVRVCQNRGKWVEFVMPGTDFTEYEVDDKVMVLYVGNGGSEETWTWDLEDCGKFACQGVIRDKEEDTVVDGIDGEFVILPYTWE